MPKNTKRILTAISNKTYRDYAKFYKIKQSINGIKKPILLLREEIKEYEKENNIIGGLYY